MQTYVAASHYDIQTHSTIIGTIVRQTSTTVYVLWPDTGQVEPVYPRERCVRLYTADQYASILAAGR